MDAHSKGLRIIREPEAKDRTGLSRVQRWRLEALGQFPKRIQLGSNSVGWLEHEIESWIKRKAAGR